MRPKIENQDTSHFLPSCRHARFLQRRVRAIRWAIGTVACIAVRLAGRPLAGAYDAATGVHILGGCK